jgi:hypothetical protein
MVRLSPIAVATSKAPYLALVGPRAPNTSRKHCYAHPILVVFKLSNTNSMRIDLNMGIHSCNVHG